MSSVEYFSRKKITIKNIKEYDVKNVSSKILKNNEKFLTNGFGSDKNEKNKILIFFFYYFFIPFILFKLLSCK